MDLIKVQGRGEDRATIAEIISEGFSTNLADEKSMKLKKPMRVHIECKTASGFRWMRQNAIGGNPPIASIGERSEPFTVFRPDRFADLLDAAECRIVETLAGARKHR